MSMTIHVQFRIACDTCTATHPTVGWADDRRIAWREARAAGWARDYEQHRCPRCAPGNPIIDRIRELASVALPDGQIGVRLGLTRGQVQHLRAANSIAGRRPGRPQGCAVVIADAVLRHRVRAEGA